MRDSSSYSAYLCFGPDATLSWVSRSADISYTLTVPSSRGPLSLPQSFSALEIHGRQSKLYVVDYTFGAHGILHHSTAAVFVATTIGSRDVLFLTGDTDQSHEAVLILSGLGGKRAEDAHVLYTNAQDGATLVTVRAGRASGVTTLWDSDEQLVLFADPVTAATFWAPPVRAPTPSAGTVRGMENFFQFGTNTTVLVGGPNLVRNASLSEDGATLALRGDLNASVPLTVVAPSSVKTVEWNGKSVRVKSDGKGVLSGKLAQSVGLKDIRLPKLGGWKFNDSLPEIQPGFDDSTWIVANKTTTNLSVKPASGVVLYGEPPLWSV